MTDQLEFAVRGEQPLPAIFEALPPIFPRQCMLINAYGEQDVVVVNKCDLVDAGQLRRIKALIKSLNPDADIITAVRSQLDLKRVLNTNRFSFEKSMLSAGWLKSLQEEVKPETEEYGIGYVPSATLNDFSILAETVCSRVWRIGAAGALFTGLADLSILVAFGTSFAYGWLSFRIREFNHRCP